MCIQLTSLYLWYVWGIHTSSRIEILIDLGTSGYFFISYTCMHIGYIFILPPDIWGVPACMHARLTGGVHTHMQPRTAECTEEGLQGVMGRNEREKESSELPSGCCSSSSSFSSELLHGNDACQAHRTSLAAWRHLCIFLILSPSLQVGGRLSVLREGRRSD